MSKYNKIAMAGIRLARCSDSGIEIVPWAEIDRVFTGEVKARWDDWFRGSTCVLDGAYPWDVEDFLENRPNLD